MFIIFNQCSRIVRFLYPRLCMLPLFLALLLPAFLSILYPLLLVYLCIIDVINAYIYICRSISSYILETIFLNLSTDCHGR